MSISHSHIRLWYIIFRTYWTKENIEPQKF